MLSKMYCKAVVVACIVVGLAVFVGTVKAEYLYTYGFDGLSDGDLNGTDNWAILPGSSNTTNKISHGESGWTGPYAQNSTTSTSSSYRPNDGTWTYSLLNNHDFDFSFVSRTYSTYNIVQAALSKDGSTGNDVPLVFAYVAGSSFMWIMGSTDGEGTGWVYTTANPTSADSIYLIGIEAKAEGSNKYTLKPYYQLLSGSGGTKTYATTAEHVTLRDLTQLNSLRLTMKTTSTSRPSRMDDYRIWQSEVFVPEPGTLALLATGLIGLLAYAWRKRK